MANRRNKILIIGLVFLVLVGLDVGTLTLLYFLSPGERGSGVLKTQSFELDRFDRVSIEGAATARITTGQTPFLEINTDENILPLLYVDVEAGKLTIRPIGVIRPSVLLLTIRSPDLQGVALIGESSVEVPDVSGESFSISITDQGIAEVSGDVGRLTVKIKGEGSVRASNLVAHNAEINITGGGNVQVYATNSLVVNCLGPADVRYVGQPLVTDNCEGSVRRLE